ncbi:MAG: hypothetical protein HKN85_09765, partial [Gammaproteobacteria bacterium]|nr:hypothetical protein [Gammaproteobacteria bacterium]
MIYAEYTNFGDLPLGVLVFYLNLACFFLVFSASFSVVLHKKYSPIVIFLSFLLGIAILVIPVVTIIYNLNFHQPFTEVEVYAILQSNIDESTGFVEDFVSLSLMVPAVLLAFSLLLMLIVATRKISGQHQRKKLILFSLLLLSVLGVVFSADSNRLYTLTNESVKNYFAEINKFINLQSQINLNVESVVATKEQTGELYIVVIGESLSKLHMGMYG